MAYLFSVIGFIILLVLWAIAAEIIPQSLGLVYSTGPVILIFAFWATIGILKFR